eukprot:8265831-Pyramimonas_sp.AAC.1
MRQRPARLRMHSARHGEASDQLPRAAAPSSQAGHPSARGLRSVRRLQGESGGLHDICMQWTGVRDVRASEVRGVRGDAGDGAFSGWRAVPTEGRGATCEEVPGVPHVPRMQGALRQAVLQDGRQIMQGLRRACEVR